MSKQEKSVLPVLDNAPLHPDAESFFFYLLMDHSGWANESNCHWDHENELLKVTSTAIFAQGEFLQVNHSESFGFLNHTKTSEDLIVPTDDRLPLNKGHEEA